jgi:NADH-quinone oxidoreductase subunit J
MSATLSTVPVAASAGTTVGLLVPLTLAGVSIYLLLPRGYRMPRGWGIVIGIAALALAGWLWIWPNGAVIEQLLFYCFSGTAILAAVAMITQSNPVHAALSFALVVLSSCGLFLLQAAPFLMAATTIVYAGAIVVTFLFVIMLAQQSGLSKADQHAQEPFLSTFAATVLLGAILVVIAMTLDLRELGALGEQAKRAAAAGTESELEKALGDPDAFFVRLQEESKQVRGAGAHNQLQSDVIEAQGNWEQWRRDHRLEAMRAALARVGSTATYLSAHAGLLQVAASDDRSGETAGGNHAGRDTVASLGGLLFSDYLISVELAGMALLVATIGTIAITARREVRR